MSTKTIAKSSTARKIVGSLGVLGAAAAVAGMGTFGSFTDSTAPVNTTVASGTVDINLAQVGQAIPVTTAGFVPGDSLTRAVNLSNDGSSALGSVVLNTTVAAPSVLTTDSVNGLQLSVKSCTVAWSATYTCAGTERTLASGPALGTKVLDNPASLAASATDHLALSISLPASADNTFQNKTAALTLTFTGTQRTGIAR
jgi:hypothetical protein